MRISALFCCSPINLRAEIPLRQVQIEFCICQSLPRQLLYLREHIKKEGTPASFRLKAARSTISRERKPRNGSIDGSAASALRPQA
jgi:hypothetical protein